MSVIKILHEIELQTNPGSYALTSTFNPAEVFQKYQTLSGKTYLRKVEVVSLNFTTQNTNTSDYYTFFGFNQNMGIDVAGVYQPILRAIYFSIPPESYLNYRQLPNSGNWPSWDLLNREICLFDEVKLTGLMNSFVNVTVVLFENYIWTNMDWILPANPPTTNLIRLAYTLETI